MTILLFALALLLALPAEAQPAEPSSLEGPSPPFPRGG
jgi:hypothetical protein